MCRTGAARWPSSWCPVRGNSAQSSSPSPACGFSTLFTLGSSDGLSTQRVSFDFLRTCQIKSTESNSVPTSAVLHHHHHHHHYSIVAASSHFVKNVVKSGEKKIIRFILSLGFYFEATVSCGAELCRNETYRLSWAERVKLLTPRREFAGTARAFLLALQQKCWWSLLLLSQVPLTSPSHIKTLCAVSLCVSLCVCERQLLALQTARAAHLEKTDLYLNDGGCHVDPDRSVWVLFYLCLFLFQDSLSEWLRDFRLVIQFLGVSVSLRLRMQTFQGPRDPGLLQVFVVFLLVSLSHDDRVFTFKWPVKVGTRPTLRGQSVAGWPRSLTPVQTRGLLGVLGLTPPCSWTRFSFTSLYREITSFTSFRFALVLFKALSNNNNNNNYKTRVCWKGICFHFSGLIILLSPSVR